MLIASTANGSYVSVYKYRHSTRGFGPKTVQHQDTSVLVPKGPRYFGTKLYRFDVS